ncbi:MAG: hypothetical protein LBG17_10010 [Bacteroidales bacterium]|nr:hypothetical protein [Bacteroidales bacterium]
MHCLLSTLASNVKFDLDGLGSDYSIQIEYNAHLWLLMPLLILLKSLHLTNACKQSLLSA